VARPERFELPTYWFEASCSIRLSYGRVPLIVHADGWSAARMVGSLCKSQAPRLKPRSSCE
jgi:hypothetical protein